MRANFSVFIPLELKANHAYSKEQKTWEMYGQTRLNELPRRLLDVFLTDSPAILMKTNF